MTRTTSSRSCAAALAILLAPGVASADTSALTDGLTDLLGKERAALAAAPADRLAEIGAPTGAALPGGYTEAALAALPAATGGAEWECLSEALYFEARGETVRGLFAVAEVILNRVEHGAFPGSVCGVINQGTGRPYACQFTYTCDSYPEVIHEPGAWSRVGKVARAMLDGAPRALTDGATHYHTRAVHPNWAAIFDRTAAIGAHFFYRMT